MPEVFNTPSDEPAAGAAEASESAGATGAVGAEAAGGDAPVGPPDATALQERIIKVIRTIFDPEIPVNIYDLGLIYKVELDAEYNARVEMTLTAPNCPAAGTLPGEVENKVRAIPGVNECKVEIVWDPPWNKDMISEAAKLDLGID